MVLATRVFVGFQPVRIKVPKPPVPAGVAVHVPITDSRIGGLRAPFALIMHVQHRSSVDQRFAIWMDGQPVCERTVPSGVTRRIDCAVLRAWNAVGSHEVTIESTATSWQLEDVEVSSHHGSTAGLLRSYVLPASSENYTHPRARWVVAAWLAIVGAMWLTVGYPVGRRVTLIARALAAAVATLFGLLVILPVVSPFLVVLSAWSFAACLVLPAVPIIGRQLWLTTQTPFVRTTVQSWRTFSESWTLSPVAGRRLAWLLSIILCGVGVIYGTRALGGADTYGYISQAELWLRGDLTIDQTFATRAPWPKPEATFAPLGYRPSPVDSRMIVPTYSPGLPMMLAAAKRLGGQQAMFWIVPACGGLLVLATSGLGSRLGSHGVGLVGAWLVATSPVVLQSVLITMSDVPAAAAWAGGFYFLLGSGRRSAIGAGVLSGVAILIRPNLAPLAGVMALNYVFRMRDTVARRPAAADMILFGTAVLPGVLAVAVINQHLFGSPAVSGYGAVGNLFALSRITANIHNYLTWLIDGHTVVVLAGLAAIAIPLRPLWPSTRDRSVFLVIGAFVLVVWAIYCMWLVFDGWWFLRFLLPSWPFMMLGVGAVAMALLRAAGPFTKPLVLGAVIALGLTQVHFAVSRSAFLVGRGEGRNVAIARLAARVTVPNSVSLSCIHTGSLRYYAGRMTLNCAQFDGGLDHTVAWLTARGVHVYAVLEDWEIQDFETRFAGAAALAALKQPIGIYREPGEASIFDLSEPPSGSVDPVIAAGLEDRWSAVLPAAPPTLVFSKTP